jgi:hypothetical protein
MEFIFATYPNTFFLKYQALKNCFRDASTSVSISPFEDLQAVKVLLRQERKVRESSKSEEEEVERRWNL